MKKLQKIDWLYPFIAVLLLLTFAGLFLLEREASSYLDLKNRVEAVSAASKSDGVVFSDIKKINDLFISEDELLAFVRNVDGYKSSFPDLVLTFKEDKLVPKVKEKYLTFTLDFTSPYEKGMEFVKKILDSLLLVEIVSLEASGKEDFLEKAKFVVVARVYISEQYNP